MAGSVSTGQGEFGDCYWDESENRLTEEEERDLGDNEAARRLQPSPGERNAVVRRNLIKEHGETFRRLVDRNQSVSAHPVSSNAGRNIEFQVKDIRQQLPNACGDACVNMMLAFHKKPHRTIGVNNRRLSEGLELSAMRSQLRQQGIVTKRFRPSVNGQITEQDLCRWLQTGPFICATKDHYVLVTGFSSGVVTIQCPLLGKRTGSLELLNKYVDLSNPDAVIGSIRLPSESPGHPTELIADTSTKPQPQLVYRLATRALAKYEQVTTRKWKTSTS
jgi:Papain-like cysteine protease AvrRpt2